MDQSLLFPLLLAMLAVFMFFNFRNQKKRAAAQQEKKAAAVPGARIQLTSGLYGTVVDDEETDEATVRVEIAPGVVTTWNRLAIHEVVPEPADDADEPAVDLAKADEYDDSNDEIDIDDDAPRRPADPSSGDK
ncbi:MAG: preprotein translocase subunit YajC [Gordonia sp. (in: high G+C Gram-positive bacteria)]